MIHGGYTTTHGGGLCCLGEGLPFTGLTTTCEGHHELWSHDVVPWPLGSKIPSM